MRRVLSALVASAALAAAVLGSTSSARAETIEPLPLPPIAGQVGCIVCPPDYVTSVETAPSPLGPTWVVKITNRGGPASQASTASVTYRVGASYWTTTASVSVPPLAAGQTRSVFARLSVIYRLADACADTLDDVPERDETNNRL